MEISKRAWLAFGYPILFEGGDMSGVDYFLTKYRSGDRPGFKTPKRSLFRPVEFLERELDFEIALRAEYYPGCGFNRIAL